MNALYAGDTIPETELDPIVSDGYRVITERTWGREQHLACVWYCDDTLRLKRSRALKDRDAHRLRLQSRLEMTRDVHEKLSLSQVDLVKVCNVWFAEQIALLMFDGRQPSLERQAKIYRQVTGDLSITRGSIRHQRRHVDKYIRGSSAT